LRPRCARLRGVLECMVNRFKVWEIIGEGVVLGQSATLPFIEEFGKWGDASVKMIIRGKTYRVQFKKEKRTKS